MKALLKSLLWCLDDIEKGFSTVPQERLLAMIQNIADTFETVYTEDCSESSIQEATTYLQGLHEHTGKKITLHYFDEGKFKEKEV